MRHQQPGAVRQPPRISDIRGRPVGTVGGVEVDRDVIEEMRRMAASGATPYEIAEMVWNGVAQEGPILWILYMTRAFGIPLRVLKGVSEDRELLDVELGDWIQVGAHY